jgi:hypothetical protein
MVINFLRFEFLAMLREIIFTIPLNPPFIKGDKGMNRMVHAKGGFILIYQMLKCVPLRDDLDILMAIKALIC